MAAGPRLLLLLQALALPGALAAPGARLEDPYAIAPAGGSVSLRCRSSKKLFGVYLRQTWPTPLPGGHGNVLYYKDSREPTVDGRFSGRVHFSGSQDNLTITMSRLGPADSGAYACVTVTEEEEALGPPTLLVVTGAVSQADTGCLAPWLFVVLAGALFLAGLGLGAVLVKNRTEVRRLCWARDKPSACVIYEDMSYSRRNTLSTPNPYS